MVLKWGLDRLSRPCFVQYNIDIEYFSAVISDSAAAKRVEILRRSASRCPSLCRHRKRGKKRLDFTPFRSKIRFRVKYAGFLHEILRLDRVPWSATRHDRTDASVTYLHGRTTTSVRLSEDHCDASVSYLRDWTTL